MSTEFIHYIPLFPTLLSVVFVCVLMSLMLIYSKMRWYIKAIISITSLSIFYLSYVTLTSSLGWPTTNEFPEKFQFIWVDVREPTETDKGAIFYWLKEIDTNGGLHKADKARVYERPYSKNNHRDANNIDEQIANGQPVYGQKTNNASGQPSKGNGLSSGTGKSNKQGNNNRDSADTGRTQEYEFIQPLIELPRKN